jgi:hypothetical protein
MEDFAIVVPFLFFRKVSARAFCSFSVFRFFGFSVFGEKRSIANETHWMLPWPGRSGLLGAQDRSPFRC